MGVVIEREEWALTPLAYPLLSAAGLAAVLLLPYFSARPAAHAAGSSPSPFDAGAGPFLRFRRAVLLLFALASGEQLPRPLRYPALCRAEPNGVAPVVVFLQWSRGSSPCSGRMSSCAVGLAGTRWPRALPLPLQLRSSPAPFLASSPTKCKLLGRMILLSFVTTTNFHVEFRA